MSSDEEDMDVDEEEQQPVQDLTNSDVITKYKMAAEIANRTLQGVITQCTPGAKVVEICQFGDTVIERQCDAVFKKDKKMEKGLAFPTCVSINECVCHFSPLTNESVELKDGDVVKIDLGVHIDGYIAVVAHTLVLSAEVTGATADVVLAAYTAAEVALKSIKVGTKNSEISSVIDKVAEAYGVKPLQGVLMHQMKRFVIDGNSAVLLREEADQKVEEFEFEADHVYTVDVVMTTGEGKPIERDARTTVFKRAVDQTYRLKMKASRYVFNEVNKRFPTLPFTIRALDERQGRMGVVECVKHDLLAPYPVLYEKPGVGVAHFKFTVLMLPGGTAKVTGIAVDPATFKSDKTISEDITALLRTSTKKKKKKKKKAAGEADTAMKD